MHPIAAVTQALFTDSYLWPIAKTQITQYGPHSVGIDIDMSDLSDGFVNHFIDQFRGDVQTTLGHPVRVVTHVGAVRVEIVVTVSKEFSR